MLADHSLKGAFAAICAFSSVSRMIFPSFKSTWSKGRCKATWKREFNLPWRETGLLQSSRRLYMNIYLYNLWLRKKVKIKALSSVSRMILPSFKSTWLGCFRSQICAVFAQKVTDLYHEPSMSTSEKSVKRTGAQQSVITKES